MSKILSIEIDNKNIKIIEASKKINGELLSINKFLSLNIPTDSIDDDRIINIDLIRTEIEKALLENNIKTKKTIFVINPNTVITRKLKLPLLKRESQTKSMIKIEFEHLLSTNTSQIIIYKKIDYINKGNESNELKYIVYGLPYNIYNQYIELSKMLKLRLIALETSSNCLEKISEKNLIINGNNYINKTTAFVKILYDSIYFCVIKDGINDFSRAIYLNLEKTKFCQIDRVSESPKEYNFDSNLHTNDSDTDVNILIDEISKNIRYYYSTDKDNNIEKIYIYGAQTEDRLECSEKNLSKILNIDVEAIKEISNLGFNYSREDFDLIEYFYTFLSLFTSKKDINFLTNKIKNHKIKVYIASAIVATTVCISLVLIFYSQRHLIMQELLKYEIHNMNLYVNSEENRAINNKIEEIKNEVDFLEEYKNQAVSIRKIICNEDSVSSKIFREIAYITPPETDVTSIIMGKNSIQMQCKSNCVEDIILFLGNIRDLDSVISVYAPTVKYNGADENNYSYSLIFNLEDVNFNEVE